MSNPHLCISYPDHAEIENAKSDFRELVVPEIIPSLLLLSSIGEDDRKAIVEAAQHVSIVPLQQRLQLLSVVSDWRSRNASDDSSTSASASASASLRGARSSYASATSATSTWPSSLASSRRGSSRQSYDIGVFCSPRNGSALDNTSHYASPSLPENCTPTLACTNGAPVNAPPHLPANPVTNLVASQAVKHKPLPSQQSPGRSSTSFSERIKDTFRKRTYTPSNNARPKELAKWVCPVCNNGFTRSETMREHVNSQCLKPKTYQCLSCPYSTRREKGIIKHCKDSVHVPARGYKECTPPARRIYASCLTGRLYPNEKELIDDTHQHCKQSKEVPLSDPNIRLRALLSGANDKQLNQEMEKQCLLWLEDSTSWMTMTWKREDALHLADMAEYGLYCDAPSTSSNAVDNSTEVVGSNLEQQRHLGITDLSGYVADVMFRFFDNQQHSGLDQQCELPDPPNVATAQSPAVVMSEQSTPGFDPSVFDAQAQDFSFSGPTHSNHHDSLDEQTREQDRLRPNAPSYQDHDPQFGCSSNRPQSVVMLDWPLSNAFEFDGGQPSFSH